MFFKETYNVHYLIHVLRSKRWQSVFLSKIQQRLLGLTLKPKMDWDEAWLRHAPVPSRPYMYRTFA